MTNTDVTILGTSISYERLSPFFPPFFPPYFDPCAGSSAAGTVVSLFCSGDYLVPVVSDGCYGTYNGTAQQVDGWCGYVNCATHACPSVAPQWNFVTPYDGGNGWINGTYNDQNCEPHCSNAGYGYSYCADEYGHVSRWIAYNDGTSCCAFNLFIFCY
jgi:hypothetical protein